MIIAVNWTGVYVVDDQEQVLLELSFPEITSISSQKYVVVVINICKLRHGIIFWYRLSFAYVCRTSKAFSQTFTLSTVRAEEFTFQSPNAEDIRDLVQFFLEGLKKRSMYAVALQDYKGGDHLESSIDSFIRHFVCLSWYRERRNRTLAIINFYLLLIINRRRCDILATEQRRSGGAGPE